MPTLSELARIGNKPLLEHASKGMRASWGTEAIQPPMALREYVPKAWRVLEPETEFVGGWHIDAICDHLEAVIRGEIRNLRINIPPRMSKSRTVSICWPTHTWTYRPSVKFLFTSYSAGLSTDHSVESRRLVRSGWYQANWGNVWDFAGDQNLKTRFDNDHGGYRMATSTNAQTTGFGGDIVVLDDPDDVRQIHSQNYRETRDRWWREVMSTRQNQPNTGGMVLVQQRCHQRDLSGLVEADDKETEWVDLVMPMEYDPKRRYVTVLGFEDPRRSEGELLCPERFDRNAVEKLKSRLTPYGVAGQLQQLPQQEGGGLFKRDWFRIVDDLPDPDSKDADEKAIARRMKWVRYWDCAATEESVSNRDPDYTAGAKVGKYPDSNRIVIAHMIRKRLEPELVHDLILSTAKEDGGKVRIVEEREGGSSGKSMIAFRKKALQGFHYEGRIKGRGKIADWEPLGVAARDGRVDILRGSWNTEFLDEMANVPHSGHDDQADAAAGGFNEIDLRAPGDGTNLY